MNARMEEADVKGRGEVSDFFGGKGRQDGQISCLYKTMSFGT